MHEGLWEEAKDGKVVLHKKTPNYEANGVEHTKNCLIVILVWTIIVDVRGKILGTVIPVLVVRVML